MSEEKNEETAEEENVILMSLKDIEKDNKEKKEYSKSEVGNSSTKETTKWKDQQNSLEKVGVTIDKKDVKLKAPSLAHKLEKATQPYFRQLKEELLETLKTNLRGNQHLDLPDINTLSKPFWKIPPLNEVQREIWNEKWGHTLLSIARKRNEFLVDLKALLYHRPFKGMRLKNLRLVVEWLKEEHLARWLNTEKTTAVVFWKTRKEIAEEVYEQASEAGVLLLNLTDLRKVYKLPKEDLRKILTLIAEKQDTELTEKTVFFQARTQ